MSSDTSSMMVVLMRMAGILADRKWFVAIFSALVTGAMVVMVLVMPSRYKSQALVIAPANGSSPMSMLSSLSEIGDKLGIKAAGGSEDDPEKLLTTIMQTRALALSMCDRFKLDSVWDLRRERHEDVVRAWNDNFMFTFDENGAISLEFEDEDPVVASRIVTAVIGWVDSAYTSINQEKARRNLEFLDARIKERKVELDKAEDSMLSFQSRTGTFQPSEQMRQSVIEAARLEAQVEKVGIEMDMEKMFSGEGSSNALRLAAYRKQLQKLLERISGSSDEGGKVLKELKPSLRDHLRFERLGRDILVHGTVYALLVQQREQVALERSRNTPLLVVLDQPSVPKKRSFPKRRAYVQAAAAAGLLVSVAWVLFGAWLATPAGVPVREEFRVLKGRLFRWS